MKTCLCNIQRFFFSSEKLEIFIGKNLMVSILLLKTLSVGKR